MRTVECGYGDGGVNGDSWKVRSPLFKAAAAQGIVDVRETSGSASFEMNRVQHCTFESKTPPYFLQYCAIRQPFVLPYAAWRQP